MDVPDVKVGYLLTPNPRWQIRFARGAQRVSPFRIRSLHADLP